MALCDQGYLCEVCGEEVEDLTVSDLYLRYVLGEVDPETLHVQPERHIACNPVLAQFIVAEGFVAPTVEGPFAKAELDSSFVADEEGRVTLGYRRLQELPSLGLSILEYPLVEASADRFNPLFEKAASPDFPSSTRADGSSDGTHRS